MARCFANAAGETAVISFDADPDGSARDIRVTGAEVAVSDCIESVVSGLTFQRFEGASVRINYPITVQRTALAENEMSR